MSLTPYAGTPPTEPERDPWERMRGESPSPARCDQGGQRAARRSGPGPAHPGRGRHPPERLRTLQEPERGGSLGPGAIKIERDALGMAEPARPATAAGEPARRGGVDTEVR